MRTLLRTQPKSKPSLLRRLFPVMLALVIAGGAAVSLFTLQVFENQVREFNQRAIQLEAQSAATIWRNSAEEIASQTFILSEASPFGELQSYDFAPGPLPADRQKLLNYLRNILTAKPEYLSLLVVLRESSGTLQILSCNRPDAQEILCSNQPWALDADPILDEAVRSELPHLMLAPLPNDIHAVQFLQSSTPFSNRDFRVHGHVILRTNPDPIFSTIESGLSHTNRVFLHNPENDAVFFISPPLRYGQNLEHAKQIQQHLRRNEAFANRSTIISTIPVRLDAEGLGGYTLGVLDPGTRAQSILQKTIYLNLSIQLIVIVIFMLASLLIARHISNPIRKLREALQVHRENVQRSDLPASADFDLSQLFDVILENAKHIKEQRRSLELRHAAQKKTEQQLKKALNRIYRAESDRNQLVKVTAHDLREPLLIIISCSRILPELIEDGDDEELRKTIGFIEDNVMRMMTQVERMRRYFRIGTNPKIEPVNVRHTCDTVLSRLNPTELSGVDIDIQGDATLKTRADDLHLILCNLIDNALTHGRAPNNPCVRIVIRNIRNGCQVEVTDNGPGIEDKFRDNVFEMFRRGSDDDQITGTGTGLSEIRHICYLHGGTIELTSNDDAGVQFTVTLYHLPDIENEGSEL